MQLVPEKWRNIRHYSFLKSSPVSFSGSSNIRRVANYIADATNGTAFELVPVTPYTSADLNWTVAGSRVNREHDDKFLQDIPLVSETPIKLRTI